MLIVGAKGFAKEVLEILSQKNQLNNLVFFDDVNEEIGNFLYNKFPILKSEKEVIQFFKNSGNEFSIGIGNPILRYKIHKKFERLRGELTSIISPNSFIEEFGNVLGKGVNIMANAILTNDITVNEGCLINLSSTIGHDTTIEKYVELCPGVNISGNCKIGKFTFIGTNAIVLPNITIGENVTIGVGSVITKNIPNNSVVVGMLGKIIKTNPNILQ